jgi:hypothetical protein
MQESAIAIDEKDTGDIEQIKVETDIYLLPLGTFRVVDADSMTLAEQTIKDINAREKAIDNKLEPKKKLAYAAYKAWVDLIAELKAPYAKTKEYLRLEGKRWLTEQEQKRRQEELRLREIAQQQEEERRLQEALQAEKEGDHEAAQAIIEDKSPVFMPTVKADIPKTDGRLFQKRWRARVTDFQAVVKYVAENPQYLGILTVDMAALNGIARAQKNMMQIPGTEAYEE